MRARTTSGGSGNEGTGSTGDLAIEDDTSQRKVRWVLLKSEETEEPVVTVAEAVAAMERLRVQRRDNAHPKF